jgi:thiamine-phosphate pyrophosphorylase
MLRALQQCDTAAWLTARNARDDVGRTAKHEQEQTRFGGLHEIAGAAAGRCEQGLRVLEEMTKFLEPQCASTWESIRYQVYDCNASLQLSLIRDRKFLQCSRLYVLADCALTLEEFVERCVALSGSGVDLIQVRDKGAEATRIVQYARSLRAAIDSTRTRVIVNDRIDIAAATAAWGVHLGQEDMSVSEARRILDPRQIVGLSTHDLAQVERALAMNPDYLGCGPTFPSQTKSFSEFAGLDFLRAVRQHLDKESSSIPAFAIGGIRLENLDEVLHTGFSRVAVGAGVWQAESPAEAASRLRDRLDRFPSVP